VERNTELKRVGFKPRTKGLRRTGIKSKAAEVGQRAKATKSPHYTGPTKKMRDAVLERDDYTCQRCGRNIRSQPYSLQHLLPRGRGGKNTMRNLVTVCGSATTPGGCHDWMENQERRLATRDGWLVLNGVDPETDTWPVLRFGRQYEQPGETGWTVVPPHPLQIEMGAAA
jgi:hypothetical protein